MDDRKVLTDPGRDDRLRQDGWVIEPLLGPGDVQHLLDAYSALAPAGEDGVQLDYVREDRDTVRRINAMLRAILDERFEKTFVDHWPVLLSFIVKHPGPASSFYLHRDITMNDPRANRCFTMWIPLVDVGGDRTNGGLGIIPGSHELPLGEQGLDATVLADPFRPVLDDLVRPVDVRAGEAVVYDARLLHGSAPNLSDGPRFAIGCGIGRRSEPLTHVVPVGRRRRHLHEIDRDFFVDHHPAEIVEVGMPAGYPVLRTFEETDVLSATDLRDILGVDPDSAPVTVLPDDLLDDPAGDLVDLTHRRSSIPAPEHDLDLRADAFDPLGPATGPWNVVDVEGDASWLPVVQRGRRRRPLPAAVATTHGTLRGLRTRDLTVLVLGRRARVRLDLPASRGARTEIVVIDGPQVRSGVRSATHATNFDLDRRIDLPAGDRFTLWNDGPGPAVLALHRTLGRPTRR